MKCSECQKEHEYTVHIPALDCHVCLDCLTGIYVALVRGDVTTPRVTPNYKGQTMSKTQKEAKELIRVIDGESYHDGSVPAGYQQAKRVLILVAGLKQLRLASPKAEEHVANILARADNV